MTRQPKHTAHMSPAMRNYIAWSVLAWVVFLGVALGVLALSREVGQALQARTEAQTHLVQAKQSLAQNDWRGAGQALQRALSVHPGIAARVVEEMQRRLIGLPRTVELLDRELSGMADHSPDPSTLLALGQLQLLQGKPEEAEATLSRAASKYAGVPALILAQLLVERGDFAEAKIAYDRYWARQTAERADLLTSLNAHDDGSGVAAETLFRLGLWEEAIALSEELGVKESSRTKAFFAALEAEMADDADRALSLYAEAARGPNPHLLSHARERALRDGGASLAVTASGS